MIIGKMTDQIDGFTIDHVNAIEYIPDSMFVTWEGRIVKVCSIPFKIGRCIFAHFNGKIGLNITE